MFETKIQTRTEAGGFVAPAEQQSVIGTAFNSIASAVDSFAQIAREDRKVEIQKQQAKNTMDGQDVALGLMKEYRDLSDTVGAQRARLQLEKKYRSTLGGLNDLDQRAAFVGTFKEIFGGAPTEGLIKQEDEALKREDETNAKLKEKGRNFLIGMGREPVSDDEAVSWGRKVEGRELQHQEAQRKWAEDGELWNQEKRGWERQDRTRTETERAKTQQQGAASAAVVAESDLMVQSLLSDLTKAAAAGDTEYQKTKQRVLTMLAQTKGQINTFVNSRFTAAGGSLKDVPQELYTQTQTSINNLEKLVNGEFLREQQNGLNKLIETDLYSRLLASEDPLAKFMVVSSVTGSPMPALSASNITALNSMQFTDPSRGQYDYITTATRVGPAATEQVTGVGASKYISDLNRTAGMPQVAKDEPAKKQVAASAVNVMEDSAAGRSRTLLGQGGVVEFHRAVAQGNYDAYREGVLEEVTSRGISLEQLFNEQMQTFTRKTLLPSLRLTGAVDREVNLMYGDGPTGAEAVRLEVQGGKVRLSLNEDIMPASRVLTGRVTSQFGVPRVEDPAMRFRAALKKAEQDLNIMLASYSKLSGEDANALAEQFAAAYGTVVKPASSQK